KGTFHGMGMAAPYTGEWALQYPAQYRMVIETEAGGQKFTFKIIMNGDKGWRQFMDMTQDMDKDALAELKHQLHHGIVPSRVPVTGKDCTLAPLGEGKVGNRPALGIKASFKDQRDVSLYFDKETHLLLKTETRVKDEGGQEQTQETFYEDFKELDGVKHPTKLTIKRDGKLYVEAELLEFKAFEKLDDSEFAKP